MVSPSLLPNDGQMSNVSKSTFKTLIVLVEGSCTEMEVDVSIGANSTQQISIHDEFLSLILFLFLFPVLV